MDFSCDSSQPLLQNDATNNGTAPSQKKNHLEASDELEEVLSNTEQPLLKRIAGASWIELKLLFFLSAPAIAVYMINFSMSTSTQIFSGRLGNLELAASSLGNNGIQYFAYGLLVHSLFVCCFLYL